MGGPQEAKLLNLPIPLHLMRCSDSGDEEKEEMVSCTWSWHFDIAAPAATAEASPAEGREDKTKTWGLDP